MQSEDKLDRAYGEAYQNGCFVADFGTNYPESWLAAVGENQALVTAEFRYGVEINAQGLSFGDCINLGAYPGCGKTRIQSIREGLNKVIEARRLRDDQDS